MERSHLSLIKNNEREGRTRSLLDTAVFIHTDTHTNIVRGTSLGYRIKNNSLCAMATLRRGRLTRVASLLGILNSACVKIRQEAWDLTLQDQVHNLHLL